MQIDILTLFPEFFISPLSTSILKRANETNKVTFNTVNIRDFTTDKHKKADDKTFGGGCGMVMKAQPIFDAVKSLELQENTKIIMLCPTGEKYNQKRAIELSKEDRLVFICGHYEGIDERVRENLITDEISIGDYVLTGGEVATLTVIDSIVRLIPDVLGNEDSANEDSFSDGLLDCPHYTRPAEYNGWKVPEALLNGNHAKIDEWRLKEKLKITLLKRFDLFTDYDFKNADFKILELVKDETENKLNNEQEDFLRLKIKELKSQQDKRKRKIKLNNSGWESENKIKLEKILNSNSYQNKKVIFDFDNTVLCGDIGEATFSELINNNLIDIDKIKSISPDFMLNNNKIILGQTVNPMQYYEGLMESTFHQRKTESEIINGYIWLVQSMDSLSVKTITENTLNAFDRNESGLNSKVIFRPEIIELIGKLLINKFKVYIVSASNVWTVRYLVTEILNKLLKEEFQKDIKIPSENVFGISTLIKDKRDERLYKDIYLLETNDRYKRLDSEETDNYYLTNQIVHPVSTFEGKLTTIKKYILKENESPFLIVGDSPNDLPMLKDAQYKLWLERPNKTYYIENYIKDIKDESWIIQKVK